MLYLWIFGDNIENRLGHLRYLIYTPRLFGHFEETISIEQVASVSVDSGLLFGDVIIETTGGSQPIRCHGHRKRHAEEIRRRITEAQAAQPKR